MAMYPYPSLPFLSLTLNDLQNYFKCDLVMTLTLGGDLDCDLTFPIPFPIESSPVILTCLKSLVYIM